MITEKEFHDALETVIKYQFQISLLIQKSLNVSSKVQEDIKNADKTLIQDFINSHPTMSVRLANILLYQSNLAEDEKIKYIEEITRKIFLSHKNAGRKTWSELCDLRNKNA